ncbi:hypothetical protein [Flavobacterium selenitireducens]|uniref:hypothetical protein n=1 Tax=Flavobacterium selenitireducens TaxID=2722704 RepID=UPI00168B2FF9|nr:hypothetical protein [Flavobacterium selenitireducens]MBD3584093.1 hypothetical protein [Flavobacterium selenitireducens]
MKLLFFNWLLLLTLAFNSEIYSQNCSVLENGIYEMFYDSNQISVGNFEINDDKYLYLENNIKKVGDFIKLDNCSFRIATNEKTDDSELTEVQRLLKKQKNYFEITKVERDVYYFICRVNLHINCGSGKFIKKRIK